MALPSSGELSFNQIGIEIQRANGAVLDIKDAELGVYTPLNPYSTFKPDGVTPCSVSEWYSYNHTQINLIPRFDISKVSPSTVNVNTNFQFYIVVSNEGNTATSGTIAVTDVLPSNMQYVTHSAQGWNVNVTNQNIVATRSDSLGVDTQLPPIYITCKIINCQEGAFYNFASISGGGTNGTVYSNTTTTIAYKFSSSNTVTRSIQKNDCVNGTGTFVNVTSPAFTRQSCFSQDDAYNLAIADCNSWLDANGQAVANANGSCITNPPNYSITLVKTTSDPIRINTQVVLRATLVVSTNPSTGGTTVIMSSYTGQFTINSASCADGRFSFNIGSGGTTFFAANPISAGSTIEFFMTVTPIVQEEIASNSATVSGGGGTFQSASIAYYVYQALQPTFSLNVSSNANITYQPSSTTTGVHLFNQNQVEHYWTLNVGTTTAPANSVRISFNVNTAVLTASAFFIANTNLWAYNAVNGYFYNIADLPVGSYSGNFLRFSINRFIGGNSSGFTYNVLYNQAFNTSSPINYNVYALASIKVALQGTPNAISINNRNRTYTLSVLYNNSVNGGININFGLTSTGYQILPDTLFPYIGSGQTGGGTTEVFAATTILSDSTNTFRYKIGHFPTSPFCNFNGVPFNPQYTSGFINNSPDPIFVATDSNGMMVVC